MLPKKFEIDQIIYGIPKSGKPYITVYRIVEENTKKTSAGEVISYNVEGCTPETDCMPLNSITDELFDSIEELEESLFCRAKASITTIVNDAKKRLNVYQCDRAEPRAQQEEIDE